MRGEIGLRTGFIQSQINRCNRNFLVANLFMALIIVAVCGYYSAEIRNYWHGPYAVSPEDIVSIQHINDENRRFVSFEHDGETGLPEREAFPYYSDFFDKLMQINAFELSLIRLQDKHLIVIVPPGGQISSPVITGMLYRLELEQEFNAAKTKEAQLDVLPFMLDTTGILQSNVEALFSMCAPFVVLFIVNMGRYAYRLANPQNHRVYRKLRKFGDPVEVADAINRDMIGIELQFKKFYISPDWIVRKDLFTIKVAKNFGKETNVLEMTFR